ncbi:sensor histidine kinase [Acidobacterium sp. S8]|uniref:sensor histidine kinase n=1 Tax=Acidobacterium sp. S8 TaxID=1641854 RepID=UPI00131E5B66|nr:histidine kinase [Acidobacterium sp. S8]
MKRIRLYILLYFTCVLCINVAYRSLDNVARGRAPQWTVISIEQATGVYGIVLLLPLVFWGARRFPLRFSPLRISQHVAVLLVFSTVHTLWNWGSREVVFLLLGMGHYDYGLMRVRFFMEFPSDLLVYALCVSGYMIYQDWLRSRDVEQQLAAARLENLSRQLQPHFLFNALNAVSGVMYEDVARADEMLARISDFLRATLRLPESPLIAVSSELDFTRRYLDVMQTRLESRLRFAISCDPQAEAVRVPALILQPLVENAVEHGTEPESGNLNIEIVIQKADGLVRITIRDHGPGPARSTGGHGLANTRQRLATAYRGEASLRLERHPLGGAVAEILIPA